MLDDNLIDELVLHAKFRPNSTAIYQGGLQITFKQLDVLINQAASTLYSYDVKPGDVIAVSIANDLASLLAMLGILKIGATIYTIPIRVSMIQRQEMLRLVNVKILVSDIEITIPEEVQCVRFDLQSLLNSGSQTFETANSYRTSAPWLIITGSGSTGVPKKIPVTHGQFRARALMATRALGIAPNDRVATLLSMEFAAGKTRYIEALFVGASIVLPDQFSKNPILFCEKNLITVLYTTVFHIEQILKGVPNDAENVLPDLKAIQVNASTVSDRLRKLVLTKISRNLFVRYGTNESGIISISTPDEVSNISNSVGRIVPGVLIQIVSITGKVLPADEMGLIKIQSAGLFNGYMSDSNSTNRVLRSGWFYTGDLGYLTIDGQLIYRGRADHMMIFNGINIYPTEIESVITTYPDVIDAAAVPLPHSVFQDVPVCAVVFRSGKASSEKELLDYCAQYLGARGPKLIYILQLIPRNEQGKLLRTQLINLLTNIAHQKTRP